MTRSAYLPVMMIALAAIFLGLNLFSSHALRGARLDFTQYGLYRLSEGSAEVMDGLAEPVEWEFFYSRQRAAGYPAIRAYADRVREMLRAFEDGSGGMIRLTEIDPQPVSAEEDAALAAGLTPIPTETGESLFFGLIGRNAIDEERVIPLFSENEEARLEYDLARLIADLDRAGAPRLGVLTALPLSPESGAPNRFFTELAGAFDLVWVENGFETLPDVEALLVIHPAELSPAQTYAIDQFALTRGRLIIMVDPMAHIALRPGPDGLPPLQASRDSSLGGLLAHWGAGWDPNTVAMDRALGLPVQVQEGGRTTVRAYPLWFSASPADFNPDDIATAALDRGVNFGTAGAFTPLGGPMAFTPLVTTSPDGAYIDADIAASAPSPDELLRGYQPAETPPVIMARLSGMAETAFPDGPPAEAGLFSPADHRDASAGPIDIVVIADADWIDDSYYIRPDAQLGDTVVADNLALALNLVDMAIGDPALVTLRSRAPSERPMTRVDELRSEAESRYVEIEDSLTEALMEAESRLGELEASGVSSALFGGGPQARAEARELRSEIAELRARLRDVERGFRAEIDALDAALQFWTIGAPAGFIILVGIAGALVRRRRRG